MKWGVLTRSPRAYALKLLELAHPGMAWDVIVAYEDVERAKPAPDGVRRAMQATGIDKVQEVALVGDDKSDVMAAYFSGCRVVIDQSTWPTRWVNANYWTMERVPDAVISRPEELAGVLSALPSHLPVLERDLEMGVEEATFLPESYRFTPKPRVDKIPYFFPERGTRQPVVVHVLGRQFGNYEALAPRKAWHTLSAQIWDHKDSVSFPEDWMYAIGRSLTTLFPAYESTIVTCVPRKPDGVPRQESLLLQLEQIPMFRTELAVKRFQFRPEVLAYSNGVVSAHTAFLDREQRFSNVAEHLYVAQPEAVRKKNVVVVDDVVTTGASLLWARRKLMEEGATKVECMALAKAINDK
jgi:hypothetical protein